MTEKMLTVKNRAGIHMLGCRQFGSHNQVALVFAVLVIYYNNELSFFEILYSFLNRSKFE